MEEILPPLVAFAGYAGVGKDVAATCLLSRGYQRHNFGDIIKRQTNALVREHFGFSAHTEDRTQKERIRRTLEAWGEDNYDAILTEYMANIPSRAVNTRLVRVREAERWKGRGGVIVLVERPGCVPATQWEADRMSELRASGLIDAVVKNDGTPLALHHRVLVRLADLMEVIA